MRQGKGDIRAQKKRYRERYPEKFREYKRRRYAADTEYRAKVLAKAKAWRAANPEQFAARLAAYREANREQIATARRNYQARPEVREARTLRAQRYRADPEVKARTRQRGNRRTAVMPDWYIRSLLSLSTGVPPALIPQQLIDAKRAHLQVWRLIKRNGKEQFDGDTARCEAGDGQAVRGHEGAHHRA